MRPDMPMAPPMMDEKAPIAGSNPFRPPYAEESKVGEKVDADAINMFMDAGERERA